MSAEPNYSPVRFLAFLKRGGRIALAGEAGLAGPGAVRVRGTCDDAATGRQCALNGYAVAGAGRAVASPQALFAKICEIAAAVSRVVGTTLTDPTPAAGWPPNGQAAAEPDGPPSGRDWDAAALHFFLEARGRIDVHAGTAPPNLSFPFVSVVASGAPFGTPSRRAAVIHPAQLRGRDDPAAELIAAMARAIQGVTGEAVN